VNFPGDYEIVQFDALYGTWTSGSVKKHHCPVRTMLSNPNDACMCALFYLESLSLKYLLNLDD
jgi:hypothetical protein